MAPSTYDAAKSRGASQRACRDAVLGPALVPVVEGQLLRLRGAQAVESGTPGRSRRGPRSGCPADAGRRHRRGAPRKRVRTTKPDPGAGQHPDLVKRNFTATAPLQLWVTDLTYVPTWAGVAMSASSPTRSVG